MGEFSNTREALTARLQTLLLWRERLSSAEAEQKAQEHVDRIWAAATETALTAAADDVKDRRQHGLRDGEYSHPTSESFEQWLRRRVGGTP